jgi:hypothetical protein
MKINSPPTQGLDRWYIQPFVNSDCQYVLPGFTKNLPWHSLLFRPQTLRSDLFFSSFYYPLTILLVPSLFPRS